MLTQDHALRLHPVFRFIALFILLLPGQEGSRADEEKPDQMESGVTLRVFVLDESLTSLPELLENQTPNLDEKRLRVDFQSPTDFGNYSTPTLVEVSGYISIDSPGSYFFRLESDHGSRFHLNNSRIIDHDGLHEASSKDSKEKTLKKWRYPFRIAHYQNGTGGRLRLHWKQPGSPDFEIIPGSALFTDAGVTRVVSPGPKRLASSRRPGDGRPLTGVHPGYELQTIRPQNFKPKVGALAFLPDGRLVVGTFDPLQRDEVSLPDINSKPPDKLYALTNLMGDDSSKINVEVIADGFLEPSGLCCVGDILYVSDRKKIKRLSDPDGDGFFDHHEIIAQGWEAWNYHQFVFGLAHHEGKLYAGLSTAMAPPGWKGMGTNAAPNGPQRGAILEVNIQERNYRIFAGGARTPNGVGFGPNGILYYCDNQGTWMPTSQMTHVRSRSFLGHHNNTNVVEQIKTFLPQGGHPSLFCDRPRAPATLYLPQNEVMNSPTEPLLISHGPFKGQMFIGELTAGGVRRAALEEVRSVWQGALFRFTQGLESGINRMVFGPDGALYVGGIGAKGNWKWKETQYGLQRLVPRKRTPITFEMHSVRALPDGLEVRFTKPVLRSVLEDPASYRVQQWNYEPTAQYGGPKKNLEDLTVRSATARSNGKVVQLQIPGMKEGRVVYLRTDPKSVAGETIWSTECWYTLNRIPFRTGKRTSARNQLVDRNEHVGLGVLPPEEAVSLFDGGDLRHFHPEPQNGYGRPTNQSQAEVGKNQDVISIGKDSLLTNCQWGDFRLHVEWLSPPGGEGQNAGNSGVYLQRRYEIQVLGTPAGENQLRANEAGALYGKKAADRNASTGPGTWQAYDIWFRAPRFDGNTRTDTARISVYWNGLLIHDQVELAGPTGAGKPEGGSKGGIQLGQLLLQAHASDAEGPVLYRNLWVRPLIPSKKTRPKGPWIDLISGENLTGWSPLGGKATYRLEGTTIIGTTAPKTGNTFLVTDQDFGDFELEYEVKVHPELNSGVQIRSLADPGRQKRNARVRGYQVEIDPAARAWSAGIYDEGRRGWLHVLAFSPHARRAFKAGAWNHFRVVAKGPVIRTWLNKVPTAEVMDATTLRGFIGLQVHGVGDRADPLEVQFRNLRIREIR